MSITADLMSNTRTESDIDLNTSYYNLCGIEEYMFDTDRVRIYIYNMLYGYLVFMCVCACWEV